MREPILSVLVEGYNDSLELGSLEETIGALAAQDYPLDRMEVVVAANAAQASRLDSLNGLTSRFARFEIVAAPGAHYYQLKNVAARAARGRYLGLLDSDVLPDTAWARTIVETLDGGADAVVGLSGFRSEAGEAANEAVLECAAAISWGFVVPRGNNLPRGMLSHNFGIRRAVFEGIRYREDLGRTCAGTFFFHALKACQARVAFAPRLHVKHVWTMGWWTRRLHMRFGHEIHLLRRIDELSPAKGLLWIAPIEPVLVCARQWLGDFSQWMAYSRAAGLSRRAAALRLPLVGALSALARGSQMAGMYGTLLAPKRLRAFALRS